MSSLLVRKMLKVLREGFKANLKTQLPEQIESTENLEKKEDEDQLRRLVGTLKTSHGKEKNGVQLRRLNKATEKVHGTK